jgi:hypothetical protein
MFVATTTADFSKLRRSGMNEGFGTPDPELLDGPRDMSLLRSYSTV